MYSKQEYRDKQAKKNAGELVGNSYAVSAAHYMEALGGVDNIVEVNNCATRLRVTVADEALVATDAEFKEGGAHGLVRNGRAFQVIVGAGCSASPGSIRSAGRTKADLTTYPTD